MNSSYRCRMQVGFSLSSLFSLSYPSQRGDWESFVVSFTMVFFAIVQASHRLRSHPTGFGLRHRICHDGWSALVSGVLTFLSGEERLAPVSASHFALCWRRLLLGFIPILFLSTVLVVTELHAGKLMVDWSIEDDLFLFRAVDLQSVWVSVKAALRWWSSCDMAIHFAKIVRRSLLSVILFPVCPVDLREVAPVTIFLSWSSVAFQFSDTCLSIANNVTRGCVRVDSSSSFWIFYLVFLGFLFSCVGFFVCPGLGLLVFAGI